MRTWPYIALVALVALCSCQRIPLTDELYDYNLSVEIDVKADVDAGMPVPVGVDARFYKPSNGKIHYNAFLPAGGGLVALSPDTYHVMAYNYDTEFTILRNEDQYDQVEAYTNEVARYISSTFSKTADRLSKARAELSEPARDPSDNGSRGYEDDRVIQSPDHLYAGTTENVVIPDFISGDGLVHIHVDLTTILETYQLIIGPVEGMQYIGSADAFVTGQGESKRLLDRAITGQPVTLHVPLPLNNTGYFNTTFTTFGRYPGAQDKVYLIVVISDLEGTEWEWEWDVTDLFDHDDHVIKIEQPIVIPAITGSSGLAPSVQDWSDIITNIEI